MKKTFSRILAFLLVTGLLAGALAAQVSTSFKLSNNPDGALEITAVNSKLVFENFPSSRQFDYLCISLLDAGGNESNVQWLSTDSARGALYNLAGTADGTYYIQVFNSSTEYGDYYSYIYEKKLQIEIKDSAAKFVLSPVYESNLEIYSSKRADTLALEYYLKPSWGIQSDDSSIISLAKTITNGITDDYKKAAAIHDWVCANIWYDNDVLFGRAAYGEQTALSVLKSRRGVCQGYASLVAALLRASGIPAKLIPGYALGVGAAEEWTDAAVSAESNHAWNEAYIGGKWIIIDATWDSGNLYEYGKKTENGGLRGHAYFDTTIEAFSNDHRIEDYGESAIPSLTAVPTSQRVFVNGREIAFDAYNIGGNNYFKLRDLAFALNGTGKQFEVGYDPAAGAVTMTAGSAYTPAGGEMARGDGKTKNPLASRNIFYLNGKKVDITAYNMGGNNYLKLRDVMELLDVYVGYDGTVIIDTSKGYTE